MLELEIAISMMQKVEKIPTSTGVDCPKGTQTIDVICSGVPSHKELHECCDVTKPFLVVEQMEYDFGVSRLHLKISQSSI